MKNTELTKVREELLSREDQNITFKALVKRFDEIDKEYPGQSWNLLQIYSNFNILIGKEEKELATNVSEQKPKTGHWIEENINGWSRKVFCSECGCPPPFEYVSSGDIYSATGYGVVNKTKFCPSCGARMERAEDEISE